MYDGSGSYRDGIKKIIPQLSLRYYFGDPYGIRTHITTVKGWCPNH